MFFIGLFITAIGHVFRIGSEINCGTNFSHKIKSSKDDKHQLVVKGFYRWALFRICRHPSYFGWFLWSIGTQLMMGNLICFIGFYKASMNFFRYRVEYEEYLLIKFFGQEYIEFMKSTPMFFPGWRNFLYLDNLEKYD